MQPFITGGEGMRLFPLARYLPLPLEGSACRWAEDKVVKGDWLLDPMGSTPAIGLELAGSGWRVLVASNNPIITFMLEVFAMAPQPDDFQAALAELSHIRRGEERLDVHLASLYQTECASCGQTIPAQHFLWRRDDDKPYARVYQCNHCGDEGEHPIQSKDLERLAQIGSDMLHRSRAIQRVNPKNDLEREVANQVLQMYLPRSLYFLFTLLNKIEGSPMLEKHRQLLHALMISILDEGNTMWHASGGRTRPRQLSNPQLFRENNLWLGIEEAVKTWSSLGKTPLEITRYPEQPTGKAGICLYPGRFRRLEASLPENLKINGAVCVFPRPNQAFWTLSAVWSGWIWGPEAVHPLKVGLERRRYDWNWYAPALSTTLKAVQAQVPGVPVFGILPEVESGFLAATLVAGMFSGMTLEGIALRDEEKIAQVSWSTQREEQTSRVFGVESVFRSAIESILSSSNQPANYLQLYSAGLAAAMGESSVPVKAQTTPEQELKQLQTTCNRILNDKTFLKRYQATQDEESGRWWLSILPFQFTLPLADEIEKAFVEFLQKRTGCTFEEIERSLCMGFPGVLTPDADYLRACLESYGEELANHAGSWQLHPRELPVARRADLQTAREALRRIGQSCGFESEGENPLLWKTKQGTPRYCYYLMGSSIISRWVYGELPLPASQCILVLPGSRSRLLALKLRNDPRLNETVEKGWRFLKLRHLRRLANRDQLTYEKWETLIEEDPPLWEEAKQISMFA